MRLITFVPGAIVHPNPITLPADSPNIDSVVSAQIIRLPSSLSAHSVTQPTISHANIIAGVDDHAVHLHDLLFEVEADNAANRINTALGPPVTLGRPAAGGTVVGVQGTRGVQNNAAAQAHGAKGGGPQNCAGAAVAAHTGTDPVVAAAPTKLTARTFSLTVDTLAGDLLTLNYREVGERILVS